MENKRKYGKSNRKVSDKKLEREIKSVKASVGPQIARIRKQLTILPDVTVQPIIQYTRRYIASSSTSGALTITDLLQTHMFAATTILLYPLGMAYKLKKIRLLSPVTTQGTTVTLWARPSGIDGGSNNFNSIPEVFIDTSCSIDKPAYLCLKPNMETPLGSWHYANNTNGNLLAFSFPQGTTMDLFMECIPNIALAPFGFTAAVVGATVGQQYARNISTNFVPVGVNQI